MSPRAPHRFYYPGNLTGAGEGHTLEMTAEESRHILRVLRLHPGVQVDVFDAGGQAWSAELLPDRAGLAVIRLLSPISEEPPARPPVNLAVAVIKRRPMDWMIEKLSELGVDTVQPLLAQRSVGQGDIKAYVDPPERWDRLAIAAAKQCGRNKPLILLPPSPVLEWLSWPRPPARNFYAHPVHGVTLLGRALCDAGDVSLPIWVAIGPEGGWTSEEQEAFAEAGFNPVLLGGLTLRSETAAIAAAAVCQLV